MLDDIYDSLPGAPFLPAAFSASMHVFHIGRAAWSEGQVLSTVDWKQSVYWANRHGGGLKKPLGSIRDAYMKARENPVLGAVIEMLNVETLLDLLERSGPAAELLKEYVFEDVRRTRYSEKPSRRCCIFAVPPGGTEENALTALRRVGLVDGTRRLMELELLDGRSHLAATELLNCNDNTPAAIETFAERYWNGEGDSDELLYDGSFRVVRIIRENV